MACKHYKVVDLYVRASVLQVKVVRSAALCKMLRIEAYTQEEASEQWDVHNGSIICPCVLVVCDHLQAVGSEHTWHETRTE